TCSRTSVALSSEEWKRYTFGFARWIRWRCDCSPTPSSRNDDAPIRPTSGHLIADQLPSSKEANSRRWTLWTGRQPCSATQIVMRWAVHGAVVAPSCSPRRILVCAAYLLQEVTPAGQIEKGDRAILAPLSCRRPAFSLLISK